MRGPSLAALASFLVVFSSVSAVAMAQQISTYAIEADLDGQNNANVILVFTFSDPMSRFDLLLPFKATNFTATSTAGPVSCTNPLGGISQISCQMNLTQDRKTLQISFQTPDLVKSSQDTYVFSGDFSVKMPVKEVLAAVKLPQGMVLSSSITGGPTVPFSNTTSTDGRTITVLWRASNVYQKPISFQVFYEPAIQAQPAPVEGPPLRVIVLLIVILGGGVGLLFFKRRQKTKDVIFSVLDDYEKRVISSIEKEGGTANQKKIVLDTNLSKAKVSRVVQKLVERGLIEVERRGRTNIVRFVKKKMGQ